MKAKSKSVVGSNFDAYVDEVEAELTPANREVLAAFRTDFTLASQLIQLRKGRKLTQTELAKRAGVNQSDISRIERGSANASYRALRRIGRVFGLGVGFLPAAKETDRRSHRASVAR
ncbi:MAG: helix-turn-helix transcriptional regulator [Chloroflexi bacterium]|nr:MAG: helix-turn-helix transcriptional regulator [Chloroflexota bacterium]